jgi:hypothetical protein
VPDDREDANGSTVLDFDQAADLVRKLARADAGHGSDAPATVADALDTYWNDLRSRGGDEGNASRLRGRLSAALLARPVATAGSSPSIPTTSCARGCSTARCRPMGR